MVDRKVGRNIDSIQIESTSKYAVYYCNSQMSDDNFETNIENDIKHKIDFEDNILIVFIFIMYFTTYFINNIF